MRTPVNFRAEEDRAAFAALRLDVGIVAAYGLILPQAILGAPARGCLNVHGSLLPRWRGAAPVQRAILAGDAITGITIMQMERGLDTGPMLLRGTTRIDRKTAGELSAELAALGAKLMVETLARLDALTAEPQPDDGVTYAHKIEKAEARLDFDRPAVEVERAVRAFNPAPGAYIEISGERLRILAATVIDTGGPPGVVLDADADHRLRRRSAPAHHRPACRTACDAGRSAAQRLAYCRRDTRDVTRFRLKIEYDGRPFAGWQRQANAPSVQAALEAAVIATTGETTAVTGCGRTDAGVHAAGQVAHVDIDRPITAFRLAGALNAHLRPLPVAVVDCAVAAPDFHARFDCTGRRYRYRIVNRRAPLTFDRGLAWRVAEPLDAERMDVAARGLTGRHDFTTFRSAHCQSASPVKTLDMLKVRRSGDEVIIEAAARSFLHHQVRSMAGCLELVGIGRWSADDLMAALAARDRAALGLNAPPDGLTFVSASYADVSAAFTVADRGEHS